MNKSKDTPLNWSVTDGKLVIEIGINTLAFCAKKKNGGVIPNNYGICDKLVFANDVGDELEHEDEIGNTILRQALDDAIQKAFDKGSCGISYPEYKKRKIKNKQ